MRSTRIRLAAVASAVTVMALAAASGSSAGAHTQRAAAPKLSGTVSVMGVWSGAEQKAFGAVVTAFEKKNPGVKIKYTSAGNNLPTVLATAVAGGNPPDIAQVPQPGLMKQFVAKHALKPIGFVSPELKANYAPIWTTLGTVNGKLYGLIFKAANKSTIWYNVKLFKAAGIKPPTTFPQLLTDAKTLHASGTPAYSIDGADGWPLTDLFENIYLRQAGPAKYDALTAHKIKWTDPSVITALTTMKQIIGDKANVANGTTGSLQIDFPHSVTQVFQTTPKAAMVFEGDFVEGVITSSTKAQPFTNFNQFPFPAIGSSGSSVMGGGDTVIMFKDTPATRAFITYLATPEADTIWAKIGGFTSPNKGVPATAYRDPIARATAVALAQAKVFRFDMSDQEPAAFGATVGKGEWQLMNTFLKTGDVQATAKALEAAAAAAFKK